VSLVVHRVTPDDWRSHRDLRLEMLRSVPDAFLTRYADVADFDEATWRARIAGQCHFQARLDGEAVGSVGVWDDPGTPDDAASLVAMYVAPRARGAGVAELLVRTVFGEAARRGRTRVLLAVTEGNVPAIRLYERMGFVYDGTRHPLPHKPDLYERGMERVLDTQGPGVGADMGG
jgi:ribosomal protein S18 acetylase RimI-like enzyme